MSSNDKIFREKSIEQLSTPDQLTGYLRVTGPGVWVVLIGIIILMAGILVWGVFGRIISTVNVPAIVTNGEVKYYVLSQDIAQTSGEDAIQIGDVEPTSDVGSAQSVTLSASDDPMLFLSGYLSPGKKATVLTSRTDLKDGFYTAEITTESLQPISLLFARN